VVSVRTPSVPKINRTDGWMTSELQTGRDMNEVVTDSDKILELAWWN